MDSGKKNFDRNLSKALEKMTTGAVKGLKLAAAAIKEESQENTPVDTGNLKSGHYTSVQENNDNAVAEIGATAEYAIFVHENTEANFTVGQAKFLETAFDDNKDKAIKLIQLLSKV